MKDIIVENPFKFIKTFLNSISEIGRYEYDGNTCYDIWLKAPLKYSELGERFKNYIELSSSKDWTVSNEVEYPNTYTIHYDKKNDDWTYILFHFFENKPDSDISIIITEIF